MENFKISLAAARVNAGMTQDYVAKKIHVSKRTIVNWEKGKVVPNFATLNTLSSLYNVPINSINLLDKST